MAARNSEFSDFEDNEVQIVKDGVERVKLWATTMKLSEDTATELINQGFDSMEAISTIEKDDLTRFRIPFGQQKVLWKAVSKTFLAKEADKMAATHAEVVTDGANLKEGGSGNKGGGSANKDGGAHASDVVVPSEDVYVREVMSLMKAHRDNDKEQSVACRQINSSNPGDGFIEPQSWKDPQVFLKSVDPNVDYYDIVDFVDFKGNTSDEKLLSEASGGTLIFRSGPAKPKLENLNVTQWSIANLAILQKLLVTGDLQSANMLDYLSYTMRIYQLISTCELSSVLFFDREYRKMQKQHKFRWATDVPHLHSVFLRPKPQSYAPVSSQKFANVQQKPHSIVFASHTPNGKPICKRFNSRKGCFLPNCKFEHVCGKPGCADKHPVFQHLKN